MKTPARPAPPPVAPADLTPGRPRRAWRQWFARTYLTIDPRSLGLGRIVLALVLLFDLLRRVPSLALWYSNEGLIPNHTALWRPPTQWMFSLFYLASWPDEAAVGFILCGLVYVGLLMGWRTRLMHGLSVVAVMSLHSRVPFLENGGDWMLGELTLWTAFLPLGRRFSVDAVRSSLRARRETTAAELNDRAALQGDVTPVVSLAVLVLVLQLANSYLFNALHKGGPTWRTGSAVHYVIFQDRMVTWFGAWLRPHMSLTLSRVLSWAALATEASLPVLLLSPIHHVVTRRLAAVTVVGLHTGFQLFINLGVFSLAMIGYTPYLLGSGDWALFVRLAQRHPRRLTVYFDAGCGVCFQLARILARLDRLARLRFVSSADADEPLPPGVSSARLTETIVVIDEAGRIATRADGMGRIFEALPTGFLWAWPLRLPGLRQLANAAYDAFARRRQLVSSGLGLAACGVPAPARRAAADVAPEPTPLRQALRRAGSALREATVCVLLAVLVSETLFINAAVPGFLKHKQPQWIMQLVAYPRLIQAWSMFASDAPTTDETVVVDATTVDGRHVDPYSQVAGRYADPGHAAIPPRLDNDSFFFNYSARIPFKPEYLGAFTEWVLAYPNRTGRFQDQIVKFDAYIIEDDSPPPGETAARNVRSRVFLSYPPHK